MVFFIDLLIGSYNTVCVSHLFYAYDTFFIEEWRKVNHFHIVNILHHFYWLQIILHKYSLMGFGVTFEDVELAALVIGCVATKMSFTYR